MGRRTGASVVVLQPAMGSYRQEFLHALEELNFPGVFLVGDCHFSPTVRTAVSSSLVRRTGPNHYVMGRRLGWQRGVLFSAIRARTTVVELNPRNLNTWLTLLLRRVLQKPTLVWGHAWPRSGPESPSDRLRSVVRRLSGHVIVYTKGQQQLLSLKEPWLKVAVAPNGLYRQKQLAAKVSDVDGSHFVWVGRFVGDKRPALAIAAMRRIIAEGSIATLVMVGDGPEMDAVRHGAHDLIETGHVAMLGWVDDAVRLHEIFSGALALVCTGYVGLNVTQSLGFGCPVVYPINEAHSPEVELLDSTNSVTFTSNDAEELAATMLRVERGECSFDRSAMTQRVRDDYSADAMAEGFMRALEGA